MTVLTYFDLLGEHLIEDNKIVISKENFSPMISKYPLSQKDWLITIHESLRRTFRSYITFDETARCYLEDGKGQRVISDYTGFYSGVDCLTLGKRIMNNRIILGYLWKFDQDLNININPQVDLIRFEDPTLSIVLNTLGLPLTTVDFCQQFLNYLNIVENIGLFVSKQSSNYMIEISFLNNLPYLKLEDIVYG